MKWGDLAGLAAKFSWLLTLLLLSGEASSSWAASDVVLPTPRDRFESFQREKAAQELLSEVLPALPLERRLELLGLASQFTESKDLSEIPFERLAPFLEELDWQSHRAEILELMVHYSGALEVIPDPKWSLLIHDFLLFFLNELRPERLQARAVGIVRTGVIAVRGERLLALIEQTPSLQKLGQILARNPSVPEDLRESLQILENSITGARAEDIQEFIREAIGRPQMEKYSVQLDDEILAEATVGAVLGIDYDAPGQSQPQRGVCKVIKPSAVKALQEDLEILDALTRFFEEHQEHYQLGDIPLSQLFQEVRNALTREIQTVEEQGHLRRAGEYFEDDPQVRVPGILPFSTSSVTCMEFIDGSKIVDAFPGNPAARARVARLLDSVMTYQVLFGPEDVSIFHGDPHAGNIFVLNDSMEDEPRLGMLDWGLSGELSLIERSRLIQLMIGAYLRSGKRLRRNVRVLLPEDQELSSEQVSQLESIAVQTVKRHPSNDLFEVLAGLITDLTQEGFNLNFNLVLFIKAQVTISGILEELDPDLKRTDVFLKKVALQVGKESPSRLVNTVYFPHWTSRKYPSLLSNEDVRVLVFTTTARKFKGLGRLLGLGISWPFRRNGRQESESATHSP